MQIERKKRRNTSTFFACYVIDGLSCQSPKNQTNITLTATKQKPHLSTGRKGKRWRSITKGKLRGKVSSLHVAVAAVDCTNNYRKDVANVQ